MPRHLFFYKDGSNEYRTLFFFESGSLIEGGKVVVIGNGFLKKDNREPMGAPTKAQKNLTTLGEHLSRQYGETGTLSRETFHANAFAAYVGALLREYRVQNELTQQVLADRIGVKKSYLSRIENGRVDLRLSTLARVLGSIGYDVSASPRT